MLTTEFRVSKDSDYYIYTPSMTAHQLFYYPTIVGRFQYLPGYHLRRNNFGNYLFMLIEEGSMQIRIKDTDYTAPAHSLVLMDCYSLQEYGSKDGATVLWMHFDGSMVRPLYEHISQSQGCVSTPTDYERVYNNLYRVYSDIRERRPVNERLASIQIYDTLLSLISTLDVRTETYSSIKRAIIYISDHFTENIPLQTLADVACLSPYYFTRSFRKETGMTPHQYILETRFRSAEFLLSSTDRSIKEIALDVGFADESSFCASFRKHVGESPSKYRLRVGRVN